MAKLYTVKIPAKPSLPFSGKYIDANWNDFVDMAGGELVMSIAKGEFKEKLHLFLELATVRGMKRQHELLLEEAKQK